MYKSQTADCGARLDLNEAFWVDFHFIPPNNTISFFITFNVHSRMMTLAQKR